MIEVAILTVVGVGTFLLWHKHVQSLKPQLPIYYGAPAWPTMNPVVVPEIALPYGLQQSATYYGVSSSLLEQYTK